METQTEIVQRWRYLRDLLIDQLEGFENGDMQLRSNNMNVSAAAISHLKKNIRDFDDMIHHNRPFDGPAAQG